MRAADVMVTKVITVGPDACVQDVAHVLLSARISGVPVVGPNGELLGIVSEGDLMRRVEAGTGRPRPWWLALFTGKEVLAAEFIREHSRKVTDVMTRHVITAAPDTPYPRSRICSRRTRSSGCQSWKEAKWSVSSAAQTCCKPWPV
jgi:CBS domain-containing protein